MNIHTRYKYLDFIHEAAFVLNDAREIVFGNLVASKLFGEFRLGQDIVQTIRNPKFLELISESKNGAERTEDTIFFEPPADGLFSVRASRHVDSDTGDTLIFVSMRDVSELQQAEAMRSDFVANVSHELRSPLSTISGFIETLKGPAKDDPAARARFLDLMGKEAERMVRLIADLLSLSKVENEARHKPVGKVDLTAVVNSVKTSLAQFAETKSKSITVDVPDTPVVIDGQHDELVQVVQNLLENALKYSNDETCVSIRAKREDEVVGMDGPAIALQVQDEGKGIAAEHLPRLTERFYRVDSHRSRSDGGTGLGLAIVKHIVQRHGGRLKIESKPGEGSTFTVFFPGG